MRNSNKWRSFESLDWGNEGRKVELTNDRKSTVVATAIYDDFYFDGEDEYPVYRFEDEGGRKVDFHSFEFWRFC